MHRVVVGCTGSGWGAQCRCGCTGSRWDAYGRGGCTGSGLLNRVGLDAHGRGG